MWWYLILIILLEGLGVKYGHELAYYLIITFPLYFIFFNHKKIQLPRYFILLSAIFLTMLGLSTINSIHVSQSVALIFLYPALFTVSIYVFNYQEVIKRQLVNLIIIISIGLTTFSYLWLIIPKSGILTQVFNPLAGFGLIYHPQNYHNNIGDFLLMIIVISFYFLVKDRSSSTKWLSILIYCLPIFWLSFSRSAYLSLIIVLLLIVINQKAVKKIHTLFIIIVMSICSLLLLITFFNHIDVLKPIYDSLNINKRYFGSRETYFMTSIQSILNYPWLGVGINNFQYVSSRFNDLIFWWSNLAHNIFLEIFVGIGLVGGLSFGILIITPIIKFWKKLTIWHYLYIVLLINFQLYYSYQIYSMIFIFFVLYGLIMPKPSLVNIKITVIQLLAVLVVIYLSSLSVANLAKYKKYYYLSFITNPFDRNIHQKIINDYSQYIGSLSKDLHLKIYERLFYADYESNDYLANYYYSIGNYQKSLLLIKKNFIWSPFYGDIDKRLINIYRFIKYMEGSSFADQFLDDYFKRAKKMSQDLNVIFKFDFDIINSINLYRQL